MAIGGRAGRAAAVVQVAELGPDLVGQRVRNGVQDDGGPEITGPGRGQVFRAEQDVTQARQRAALAERSADLTVGVDGLLVVASGLGQVT